MRLRKRGQQRGVRKGLAGRVERVGQVDYREQERVRARKVGIRRGIEEGWKR